MGHSAVPLHRNTQGTNYHTESKLNLLYFVAQVVGWRNLDLSLSVRGACLVLYDVSLMIFDTSRMKYIKQFSALNNNTWHMKRMCVGNKYLCVT